MSYLNERRNKHGRLDVDLHQDRNCLLDYCEKLEVALKDASKLLADSPQKYSEAISEDDWFNKLITEAKVIKEEI